MKYDPIKAHLGRFFNKSTFLRRLFYWLLDLLLLRAWHVHHHLKSVIRKNRNSKDFKVLDAGFGFGQYLWYLASRANEWQYNGIELKSEQVEDCKGFFGKAKSGRNVSLFTGDLTTYIEPSAYNLILSVDVMEHVANDQTVFENFHTSLKPGGMLLISTPSDQGGSGVEHEHDTSFIEEHVRDGYSIRDIKSKLNTAGFQKVEILYTYGKPGSVAWKLSMKYPILMLGKSNLFYFFLPFYYLIIFPVSLILNYADVHLKHNRGTGLLVKAWK